MFSTVSQKWECSCPWSCMYPSPAGGLGKPAKDRRNLNAFQLGGLYSCMIPTTTWAFYVALSSLLLERFLPTSHQSLQLSTSLFIMSPPPLSGQVVLSPTSWWKESGRSPHLLAPLPSHRRRCLLALSSWPLTMTTGFSKDLLSIIFF